MLLGKAQNGGCFGASSWAESGDVGRVQGKDSKALCWGPLSRSLEAFFLFSLFCLKFCFETMVTKLMELLLPFLLSPLTDKMTFQWTAVAAFLYAEIVILLFLCIPIISPLRWQKVFSISVWSKLANFWNKAFLTTIVLLIVLFLDAVREVRKYSSLQSSDKTTQTVPNAFDHIQMKLFRAQRNLYISGFSLFLWLVLRRIIFLITMLAKEMRAQMALETEVGNTGEVAKKYLEENEKLQQALKKKKYCDSESLPDEVNKELKQEVEMLKAELKKYSHAFTKTVAETSAVKKQSENLKKEYDNLAKEHQKKQDSVSEKCKKKSQ